MDFSPLLGTGVLLFAAIGLLGGAHCIGMCGPLVTVYASRMDDAGGRTDGGEATAARVSGGATGREGHLTTYEVRQHALFNLGRAASYATVGTALGALGYVLFAHGLMAVGIRVPHPGLPFRNPLDAAGAAHGGM
ncbi:hypothetical protein EKH57_08495 [Halorubrum sp. BOL3-1]|nr:sulfite exporter TauE/SafE family protein [Halorubrum sp. BOL3-1]QAU12757.1 hypothetical protein EKH57_08495 [Halorubrum sp. BOL3-1]